MLLISKAHQTSLQDVILFFMAWRAERMWHAATYFSLWNRSKSNLNFINVPLKRSWCNISKRTDRIASWPQRQKQGNMPFFHKDQSPQGSAKQVCTNLTTNDLTPLKTHPKGRAVPNSCESSHDERKAKIGGKADPPFSSVALDFREEKPLKDDAYYVSYKLLFPRKEDTIFFSKTLSLSSRSFRLLCFLRHSDIYIFI